MSLEISNLSEENQNLSLKLHRSRESNMQLREELALMKRQNEELQRAKEKLKREKGIVDIGFNRSYQMEQANKLAAKRVALVKKFVTETVQEKVKHLLPF